MKKRWIALWVVVFLCAGTALAAAVAAPDDPDDDYRRGMFSSLFDNY